MSSKIDAIASSRQQTAAKERLNLKINQSHLLKDAFLCLPTY
jgi:hypothetical protein